MTPNQAISALDRQLAMHGQTVILRRYSGNPRQPSDIEIRAFVRPVKAEQMAGDIDSTFENVVVSPTGCLAMWPLLKGDKVVIDGRERNIEFPKMKKLNDAFVRADLLVGG